MSGFEYDPIAGTPEWYTKIARMRADPCVSNPLDASWAGKPYQLLFLNEVMTMIGIVRMHDGAWLPVEGDWGDRVAHMSPNQLQTYSESLDSCVWLGGE